MNIDTKKITIMWELSLKCNLDCDFCYQKERRIKQEKQISYDEALKIIDNLDINCHISFIWWESFLFPRFIDILKYLDEKWITYEITSNGTITYKFVEKLNQLKNLVCIIFSVDFFWEKQDQYRNYKWLFKLILDTINKLTTKVNINTVIFPETSLNHVLKLHLLFEKLNIDKHYLLIYSSYNKSEYENSIKKINHLDIKTYDKDIIDYINLNFTALDIYKKIHNLNKRKEFKSSIEFLPKYLLKNKNSCKHLENQIRINENWNLNICHYINNNYSSLIENKLSIALKKENYCKTKNQIKEIFPLEICNNCCSKI